MKRDLIILHLVTFLFGWFFARTFRKKSIDDMYHARQKLFLGWFAMTKDIKSWRSMMQFYGGLLWIALILGYLILLVRIINGKGITDRSL